MTFLVYSIDAVISRRFSEFLGTYTFIRSAVSTAGARQTDVQPAVTIDRSWQIETDVLKHL